MSALDKGAAIEQIRRWQAGKFKATLADALVWESFGLGRIFHEDGIPRWYANETELP